MNHLEPRYDMVSQKYGSAKDLLKLQEKVWKQITEDNRYHSYGFNMIYFELLIALTEPFEQGFVLVCFPMFYQDSQAYCFFKFSFSSLIIFLH